MNSEAAPNFEGNQDQTPCRSSPCKMVQRKTQGSLHWMDIGEPALSDSFFLRPHLTLVYILEQVVYFLYSFRKHFYWPFSFTRNEKLTMTLKRKSFYSSNRGVQTEEREKYFPLVHRLAHKGSLLHLTDTNHLSMTQGISQPFMTSAVSCKSPSPQTESEEVPGLVQTERGQTYSRHSCSTLAKGQNNFPGYH